MSDEKYKVFYADDEGEHVQEVPMKGQAFAVAKRRVAKIGGLRIEVTRMVAVPSKDADPKRDVRDGRRWWRSIRRWDFYPDGAVEAIILAAEPA